MSAGCDDCGRPLTFGYFSPDDTDDRLCAVCWRAHEDIEPLRDRLSGHAYERDMEYYDHQAAKDRRRVIDNDRGGR